MVWFFSSNPFELLGLVRLYMAAVTVRGPGATLAAIVAAGRRRGGETPALRK